MPFHDLNVLYTSDHASLNQTLAFLSELNYSTVALTITAQHKLPQTLTPVPVSSLAIPHGLNVLTRITLTTSDTSSNHRLHALAQAYSLVALRPTNEKSFQLACSTLDCDLISLDFSARLPFPLKFKTVASALQRGVRFEINYSPAITGGSDARRNLISNAAALIRATRGNGIILSSEVKSALGVRAPWDAVNLARVWGLGQEKGREAVVDEAGKVVRLAQIKRTSFRGVVDIVEDGSQDVAVEEGTKEANEVASLDNVQPLKPVTVTQQPAKRKASAVSLKDGQDGQDKNLSKREQKRRAKKARLERAAGTNEAQPGPSNAKKVTKNGHSTFAIRHEALT